LGLFEASKRGWCSGAEGISGALLSVAEQAPEEDRSADQRRPDADRQFGGERYSKLVPSS
jgi:hypothetical protein